MSKTVIGIQARLTSTRFPRKVLAEIAPGLTVLESCIRGCLDSRLAVVLLIPDTPENDELEKIYGGDERLILFRGPEDDVLARYTLMCDALGLKDDDYVVRICGECPFVDGELVWAMAHIATHLRLQYLSNVLKRTYPVGLDVEAVRVGRLRSCTGDDPAHREHVTLHIREVYITGKENYYNDGSKYPIDPDLRWTVDTPEDLKIVQAEYQRRQERHEHASTA